MPVVCSQVLVHVHALTHNPIVIDNCVAVYLDLSSLVDFSDSIFLQLQIDVRHLSYVASYKDIDYVSFQCCATFCRRFPVALVCLFVDCMTSNVVMETNSLVGTGEAVDGHQDTAAQPDG